MLRRLLHSSTGTTAAEFAMMLPIIMLFLLGIIDAGLYAWAFNRAEKATQMGARMAVTTQIIPGGTASNGLYNYSFAVSGGIPQGTVVPAGNFPDITCEEASGTLSCPCNACAFSTAIDTAAQTAWDNIVARMKYIYPEIDGSNVVIEYRWSGLGFAGDPNGADVAPLVTVKLKQMKYKPLSLYIFKQDVPVPAASYTLTMEDGQGTVSN
ncbi:TadE/TadG family type IV pilus assembly protein [Novosphingobium mangrovi (ex Huang et al. 2023)]|uniref:Pilus assembly protein n=1 Tax=Novosphingobium mangrovi (ex Huang et al. 2023) TaxID=2976432 RepID=A0ABT2I640_9SPHN|nr:TadE family protein [Novosphingobium mangrovi (ex Huang et al. 2023)]MCT2400063.1 pilus assembly protein [Novosphingobium mangrovi (ex Huang et al. 2023)]